MAQSGDLTGSCGQSGVVVAVVGSASSTPAGYTPQGELDTFALCRLPCVTCADLVDREVSPGHEASSWLIPQRGGC